jgi:hypothetical protein
MSPSKTIQVRQTYLVFFVANRLSHLIRPFVHLQLSSSSKDTDESDAHVEKQLESPKNTTQTAETSGPTVDTPEVIECHHYVISFFLA